MQTVWEEIKSQIYSELPKNSFSLWINNITFLEKKDNSIILGCPNKFSYNWVMENYMSLIQDKLHNIGKEKLDLVLTVQASPKTKKACDSTVYPRQLPLPNIPKIGRHAKLNLNKAYSFDRFVVGHSNEFAYSASNAFSQIGSWHYNMLLMLAKTGLGKTHLSQAVGQTILANNPESLVYYITAEDFTNEMIFSLKNNRIEEFKNRYRRRCDVLILEEIHFLSGKEKTQLELGYTLDALCNDNKKVMFTSSLPPKDIPKLSRELSSRFTSGLVMTIDGPDHDTRVKILEKKAAEHNIILSKEVILFLAGRLKTDIRQMESALKCLEAKSSLLNKKISMEMAKDVVSCLVSGEKTITPDKIKNLVTKYYKVTPDMLESKSRKKIYAYPRNVYLYLCRRFTDETLENLATTVNRSHSSVLYGSTQIEKKIKNDKKTQHQLTFLSKKLEEMTG